MPRRARRASSTGIYHVMVRGLNKMPIFKGEKEKTRIVNLIGENLPSYEVAIYAYCIMPNHMHLLVKADLKELASFMAKILAAFARYYNDLHQRIGYVCQDRFKSQCVENESYFWNCMRYIHRNPHPRGTVDEMLQYTYSSMHEIYQGKPEILDEDMLSMVIDRFGVMQNFLEFHQAQSRDIFDDVEEEMEENYLRIANEIFEEFRWRYDLPKEELLRYTTVRKEFEDEVKKVLQVSLKKVLCIEENIEKGAKGTG